MEKENLMTCLIL